MIIDILTSWWCIGLIGVAIGIIISLIGLDFKHFDGIIHITEGEEADKYLFEFRIAPEQIPKMKQVIFTVKLEPNNSQNLHGF